jgi:thymidylate synthase (FAD)
MSSVRLIWITPNAELQLAYIARVSNPKNQDNPDSSKLLRYCIEHKHWSIFEMANMCMEINTTRSISPQILRHRSFTFQEFSQRYADVTSIGSPKVPHLRRQDQKNRQNSIDDLDAEKTASYYRRIQQHFYEAEDLYREMVSNGVAKECARDVLPLASPSRLYMNGTVRSWIHYIDLRSGNGTQAEHKKIALMAKEVFKEHLPTVAQALCW